MFLGALVDAGVPFAVLEEAVSAVGLEARLELRRVNRSGVDAAKVDVATLDGELAEVAHAHAGVHASHHDHSHEHDHHGGHSHPHEHDHAEEQRHPHGRSLSVIQEIIRGSRLSSQLQSTALRAFELLGHAEAKIHNIPIETIHFHEVGAVDAIADIVAVAAGCYWLKTELQVERWICSPLNVGGGHVHCAHGVFPVPAPATLELLRDLPVYSSGVQKELVTPTGAALLRALDVTSSNFPAMTVHATGYGAGSRDLPGRPNVLRVVIGESDAMNVAGEPGDTHCAARVGVLETTIDDATPELLSYVADRLMAAGASDVYRAPVQMKKGRTGIQLTILCPLSKAEELRRMVFAETTTLGLRYREEQKFELARRFVSVDTQWGEIRIKIGMLDDGKIVNYAPEFEDCRLVAERYEVPLKQVMQVAVAAYVQKEARS
jgi:uncharacterized protein (TIGR00299 family) protein